MDNRFVWLCTHTHGLILAPGLPVIQDTETVLHDLACQAALADSTLLEHGLYLYARQVVCGVLFPLPKKTPYTNYTITPTFPVQVE